MEEKVSPRRVCENTSGRGPALKHFRPPSEDKGSARMLPASLTAIKGKGAPRGIGAHRGGTVFFRSEDYAVGTRFGRPVPRTWNRVPPPPREYSSPTIVHRRPVLFCVGRRGQRRPIIPPCARAKIMARAVLLVSATAASNAHIPRVSGAALQSGGSSVKRKECRLRIRRPKSFSDDRVRHLSVADILRRRWRSGPQAP
jgi:hypothetical protein